MTPDLIVIPPTMSIEEMEFLMKERRLHHLMVCGRGGALLGIISDRDLQPQRGSTAQQLMSHPVLTATPETPLNPAITFLINENISCLPVVEDGQLCGILTTTDLVLSLQCMLQLWLRMAQVLQQDSGWSRELDTIAASLDGNLSQSDYAAQVQKVRAAIHQQLEDILNCVDLRTDVLTGIDNRRGLEEMFDMLLAAQNRYGHAFSMAIVVIDHFQEISKSCGDAAAAPLLKTVAKMIQQSIRGSDFVARFRNDAFAVVLTHTGPERAASLCHRLHDIARQNTDLECRCESPRAPSPPSPAKARRTCSIAPRRPWHRTQVDSPFHSGRLYFARASCWVCWRGQSTAACRRPKRQSTLGGESRPPQASSSQRPRARGRRDIRASVTASLGNDR